MLVLTLSSEDSVLFFANDGHLLARIRILGRNRRTRLGLSFGPGISILRDRLVKNANLPVPLNVHDPSGPFGDNDLNGADKVPRSPCPRLPRCGVDRHFAVMARSLPRCVTEEDLAALSCLAASPRFWRRIRAWRGRAQREWQHVQAKWKGPSTPVEGETDRPNL